jgi:hypothetical protein
MVAFHNWTIQLTDTLEALSRTGVVTHYVAQAHKIGASVFAGIGQHGFERLEISMYVTKDCETHLKSRLKPLNSYNVAMSASCAPTI